MATVQRPLAVPGVPALEVGGGSDCHFLDHAHQDGQDEASAQGDTCPTAGELQTASQGWTGAVLLPLLFEAAVSVKLS